MLKKTGLILPIVAGLTLSVVGCGTNDAQSQVETLELIGSWASAWGTEVITADKWNRATIIEYDNKKNRAITQLPADDEYNPSKFARMVWTEKADNSFYFCTEALGKLTVDEARNSDDIADSGDLDGAGCNGFPWTKLVPAIEVHGTWITEWGSELVTSQQWNATTVISYDNKTNTAITQNPDDDEYYPGEYSKLVWTEISADGFFHYCTVAYGEESAEAAIAAADKSDNADLNGAGCSGYSWTKLNPAEK